jgi:peptidoglycan/xylan/chitin deacetylase (PgdA/CDA1 family)
MTSAGNLPSVNDMSLNASPQNLSSKNWYKAKARVDRMCARLKSIKASIRTQWQFGKRVREGIPVLMFHKIGECPAAANLPQFYVSPGKFSKLLDNFKRKQLHSVSLSEAIQPTVRIGNRFIITFDDGYEGALIYAAQSLRRHGFSAIQFLVADRLGQRNEWDLGVDTTMERLMDRTQVQEWLSLGFEIGAHTLTHPLLPAIPIAAAKNEIIGSKKKLEDLFGIPVKHFAYPYGGYNNAILDLVGEAGFETATTCDPGVVHQGMNAFRLGRFCADEGSLMSLPRYILSYLPNDLRSVVTA